MDTLTFRNTAYKLDQPLIMGILNVTPDSFYDGRKFFSPKDSIAKANQMVREGVDIIDVGGESARPGSKRVSIKEELARVLPVLSSLIKELDIPISIDTMKPEVAKECLELGAHMVNDVNGLRDEQMTKVVARYDVPVIIMHMQGTPETMQLNPAYGDVVKEIKDSLEEQAIKAKNAGITQIIIDPGIGFGKTLKHNLEIIKRLGEFKNLRLPVAISVSRKSHLGVLLKEALGLDEIAPPEERLEASLAETAVAVLNGANIIRTHDVLETKRFVSVIHAIKNAS